MNSYIYEAIEHGVIPVKIFMTSIGQSSYHWHYDYELILVLKGSLALKLWPESCVIGEGNIVLINSKSVHGLSETNENNICLIIQMKQELFENWRDKNQSFCFYLNSSMDTVKPKKPYETFIRTAAGIGLCCYEDTFFGHYRMKALLYTLVADIFEYTQYDIRQYADKNSSTEEADVLLRIIEYIEKNFNHENIADELCRTIGMSDKTLYRFLKLHTNLTLKELLTSIRLEKALYLLSDTEKTVSWIAQECGFKADNTFYRIFKNEYGITPVQYRQNGTKVEENKEIQGYIDYNRLEAVRLLKKYI